MNDTLKPLLLMNSKNIYVLLCSEAPCLPHPSNKIKKAHCEHYADRSSSMPLFPASHWHERFTSASDLLLPIGSINQAMPATAPQRAPKLPTVENQAATFRDVRKWEYIDDRHTHNKGHLSMLIRQINIVMTGARDNAIS